MLNSREIRSITISIHALLAESDSIRSFLLVLVLDFYPRSPCGERPYGRINDISRLIFLSTLSLRRATFAGAASAPDKKFLSTLSLRRATIFAARQAAIRVFLSTLSLRRATRGPASAGQRLKNFYPRSPCGERLAPQVVGVILIKFLSTLSLRRATSRGSVSMPKYLNFYPRSPCGERLCTPHSVAPLQGISIHALLAESDPGPNSMTPERY